MINLKNLHYILTTSSASIEDLCRKHGLDPVVSLGVAKLLIANDGNLASLSPKQRAHFESSIKPLID